MKYIKTFEKNRNTSSLDKGKITDAVKRKVKHFQDFFKNDNLTIDKEVTDKEELSKDIQLIFKKFSKMWNCCELKYKKCSSCWDDFLFHYNELIMKYGYKPKEITKDLINDITVLNYVLADAYGGYISKNEDDKKLYNEIEYLSRKIYKGYVDLEDEMKKYNL